MTPPSTYKHQVRIADRRTPPLVSKQEARRKTPAPRSAFPDRTGRQDPRACSAASAATAGRRTRSRPRASAPSAAPRGRTCRPRALRPLPCRPLPRRWRPRRPSRHRPRHRWGRASGRAPPLCPRTPPPPRARSTDRGRRRAPVLARACHRTRRPHRRRQRSQQPRRARSTDPRQCQAPDRM